MSGLDFRTNDAARALDQQQALDVRRGYAVVDVAGGSNLVSAGSGDFEYDAATGDLRIAGSTVSATQQTVDFVGDISDSDDKLAVIYRDTNGDLQKKVGEPGTREPASDDPRSTHTPAAPTLQGTDGVILAEVLLPAGASSIGSTEVRDRRVPADVDVEELTASAVTTDKINDVATVNAADGPSAVQFELDNLSGQGRVYVYGDHGTTYTWDGSVSVPQEAELVALGDYTIKAGDESNLDTVDLHGNTYHTLIYNENAATGGTSNVLRPVIRGFTIDFDGGNKSNSKNYAAVLLSEAQLGRVVDVEVDNAVLNVDTGNGWRAFGILLLDCENCLIRDSEGLSSGYEGVGIRGDDLGSVADNINGSGDVHGFQIATFIDSNDDQIGNPVGSKLINSRVDDDITIHGPGSSLASGADGFVYGCKIENSSSKDEIRLIGNHYGTRVLDTYGCTIVVEPVVEKSLKNITIEGHTVLETADQVEEAVQLVDTNGGGVFQNITLRDVTAECAYLVEINETDTGGSWDNIVIEDCAHASSAYTGTEISVYIDGGASVDRLSIDNVESSANNLVWYNASITRMMIKNTDLSEPADDVINDNSGSITRLEGRDNTNADLPDASSTVKVEDGIAHEALGGAAPTAGDYEDGDIVEDTDNSGDAYLVLDSSGGTTTQIGT